MTARKRAALYLRVSTEDQTTANQRPELEAMARARGWEVVAVYEETGSAAKVRPRFARMLLDARAGNFDVIAVWALDRFGRSMAGVIRDVTELDRLKVALVSVRDPWLDTGGPTRDLLLAILAWVAEFERKRLVERTRAGMDEARRAGVPIGRPRSSPVALAAAAARVEAGDCTRAEAAAAEGVSVKTLQRYMARKAADDER